MRLKFCANLSTMFPEIRHFPSRYEAAERAGFSAVECWELFSQNIDEVIEAKRRSGVQQVAMGSYLGDVTKGEFGLASLPSRKDEFKKTLESGIEYCKALDCKIFHVTAGNYVGLVPIEAAAKSYRDNLGYAVSRLEKEGITAIIEPISPTMRPTYYMTNVDLALDVIKEINSPNLRLELDIFHLQLMCGNITNKIKEALPYTAHVQIAQTPERHEPNSNGELNYRYILDLLEQLGYDGWIGCEYVPKGKTAEENLNWITDYGYRL